MHSLQISSKQNLALLVGVCAGLLWLITGCQSLAGGGALPGEGDNSPNQNVTPALPVTPKPLSTAADTISSNPQPTVINLVFWTVERLSPQTDLVAQQLAAFEAANPNVKVKTYLKKTSGQAGILSYLNAAQSVAPGVLPDIIVLSTDQLPQAWRANLIQPLDGKIDRTIVQDLLPAAQKLATVDGKLAGIPFEIDVEHLVYNTLEITATPVLWEDVLADKVTYQFPAKGQSGLLNDASTIQYLSAAAKLTDDNGAPVIDKSALQAVLAYYQTARDEGILGPRILEAGQSGDLWSQYLANPTGMIHINAHRYLNDRHLLGDSQAAAIPTQTGNPVTIGHGWAFAVVAKDPRRQDNALKLIETFMQTDANATWATRTAVIPTRQSAFNLIAGNDDPYWNFLSDYLQTTIPPVSFAGYDQLSRILQQAVVQVISGEATPAEAVDTAVNALRQ